MMSIMAGRHHRAGVALLLCLLQLLHRAEGVFFYVEKQGHRCFFVDIPAKTSFHAEYESPDTTELLKTQLTIFAPNAQEGQENVQVKKETTSNKGSVSYTSTQNGDHWVCVSMDSSDYALPEGARMKFSLKIALGASKQEYQDLAKKSQMDELQLEILKLKDRVGAIQRNQDYAKEKSLIFQRKIEGNNESAMWVSILQIGILLVTGIYQAHYLRKYFHKKKLV